MTCKTCSGKGWITKMRMSPRRGSRAGQIKASESRFDCPTCKADPNLSLIKQDPKKVSQVAALARKLGLLIRVDGLPFGKSQNG